MVIRKLILWNKASFLFCSKGLYSVLYILLNTWFEKQYSRTWKTFAFSVSKLYFLYCQPPQPWNHASGISLKYSLNVKVGICVTTYGYPPSHTLISITFRPLSQFHERVIYFPLRRCDFHFPLSKKTERAESNFHLKLNAVETVKRQMAVRLSVNIYVRDCKQ